MDVGAQSVRSAFEAGAAYFAVVFGVGFLLGTFRVLALAPRFGETAAVMIELPVILAASWLACRWLTARFSVPARPKSRLAMGGLAFALLISAEIGLSILVFGRTLSEYLQSFGTTPTILGLLGQVAFALFPTIQLSTMLMHHDRRE
jgi:hypothetical protein